jgi:tetratricopeptide (TPR) repeat protein
VTDDPPQELREAIALGRALIVCGAGVSRGATDGKAPGWAQLIRDALAVAAARAGGMDQAWAKGCQIILTSDSSDDWLDVANIIQRKLGGTNDGHYRGYFVEKLCSLKATRPEILQAIVKIAAAKNRIATTNYDHLIWEALRSDRVVWDRAEWTQHERVIEALRGSRPAVWHIHGDVDRPNSIIFSQNDYKRIAESEFLQAVQRSAVLSFTLVFVGCSSSGLSDENVGRLLEWMRKGFSGLSDKHFVLVADDDKTDTWPDGVTPVRFGATADLPAYLDRLAPNATLPSALPANPSMIGRTDQLEKLVKAILGQDRPVVIPGALGMGKTTLALAAAYDARVVKRFGAHRFFVNLEPTPDADGVVRRLAADLGVAVSGAAHEVEAKIADACAGAQTLAILDNLEMPWHKDAVGTTALLGRLAAIKDLCLVATVRGEPPNVPDPGAVTLQDVERLSDADARSLFLRYASSDHFAVDGALPNLLGALDGHPLSIKLLALNAAGGANLTSLAEEWAVRRAYMLQHGAADDRTTSLRVSLAISLKHLGTASAAGRLLRLMALLPDGMAEADARTILSDGEPTRKEREAVWRLEKARLASRANDRWRLISPVRELIRLNFPPKAEDREWIVRRFLARAALGEKAGTQEWNEVSADLTAEEGNLDAMIEVATEKSPLPQGLSAAIRGLAKFHRHTGLASTKSLLVAAERFRCDGDKLGEAAACIQSLGDIAVTQADHEAGREYYEEALSLYRRTNDVLNEANCIRSLGDIALFRSDFTLARQRFEAAFELYDNQRDKAGCIERFGDIAFRRSDLEGARQHYKEALELFKEAGYKPGEAGCIRSLGDVDFRGSNLKAAHKWYHDAWALYQKIGDEPGEAGCIQRLGDVAVRCCELEEACKRDDRALLVAERAHNDYAQASRLYEKIHDAKGQFDCVKRLGDVAFKRYALKRKRDDLEGARPHYDEAVRAFTEAKQFFKQIGHAGGQAACIERFGDIALDGGKLDSGKFIVEPDHEGAFRNYSAALDLFKSADDKLGQANCIRGLGDVAEAKGELAEARKQWKEAIQLYSDAYWIGATRSRLAFRAATPAEADEHCEETKKAWASIYLADLIDEYLCTEV